MTEETQDQMNILTLSDDELMALIAEKIEEVEADEIERVVA